MKQKFATLYTPFEKDLNIDMPWAEYPRPQLMRDSFINLNGRKLTAKTKLLKAVKLLYPFRLKVGYQTLNF